MLETLSIRNVAIIDSAEIPFREGLNILSGETGAGKSIVLEAISLLLGSRASAELIRSGCDEAVVEGLFDVSEIPWIRSRMESLGFESSSKELLIKRSVHKNGKHRISINGEMATLSILQKLCEGLIDLCGQHEHQSLTRSPVQLELLDRYGGLTALAAEVSELLSQLRELTRERDEILAGDAERRRRADFLKFQLDELREADLKPGEDNELVARKQLLQSSEARAQLANAAGSALDSEEGGALSALRLALLKVRALEPMDARARPALEALERAAAEAEEASLQLQRYSDGIELNADELAQVQERLARLADLRRKYGASVAEMLETQARLESEYAGIDGAEARVDEMNERIAALEVSLGKKGGKLFSARQKAAQLFSTTVTAELKDLKMAEARFSIHLEQESPGLHLIQFLVQTNRGEPAKPLGKIASGGELSRLMLAVRRVISDRGGIGVYLFDEIDAGIGGQTAFQVGKKLKSVAAHNQVLCITHLPQVASFADHHLVVRKRTVGKRTVTEVAELASKDRKEELARMLGGPELTRKSLENAAELLALAT